MQIKQDAKVTTADSKAIGHVDRVVMDPATREITHLIVRQGWLVTEDKVLPFDLVEQAGEDEVNVRADAKDLENLPLFEETHYIPELYSYPEPGYVSHTQRNIPDHTVALKDGAKVMSNDGQHVGNVEQIVSDAETGRATHFGVSTGMLLREHKLIPSQWVCEVMENKVRLVVNAQAVNHLCEYAPAKA